MTHPSDKAVASALHRIDRAERAQTLAIVAAAVVEALGLGAFVLLADFSNRVHLLVFLGACLVYTTLALGLIALGAFVKTCTHRLLKAIELLDRPAAPI